jgi:hypothetical protein
MVTKINECFGEFVTSRWDEINGIGVEDKFKGQSPLNISIFRETTRITTFKAVQQGESSALEVDLPSLTATGNERFRIFKHDLSSRGLGIDGICHPRTLSNAKKALATVKTAIRKVNKAIACF